jgi:membrane-bound serine protease (ClpP class)
LEPLKIISYFKILVIIQLVERGKITGRLVIAVFSTLLWEAALAAIVLLGLPEVGIEIPLAGVIALMVALAVYSFITYRMGSKALKRKRILGQPDMIGTKGRVVSPLTPDGTVKIHNELWEATSIAGWIESNEEITVIGQNRLKLIVRKRHLKVVNE